MPFARGRIDAVRSLRQQYVVSRIRDLLPHWVKVRLRRVWLRVARRVGYPISSPRLPRPPLAADRRRMRVSHVLLACDLNPDYLDFWPSTRRAWREIVRIEPVLVLVGPPDRVPVELRDDPDVVVFPPVEGAHVLFQAQTVRLLYPALVETDGAVMISDIDLFPLDPSYFHSPVANLDERFFVAYRDTRLHRRELPIAFNAARPETWAEIFDVHGDVDVRARLNEWGSRYEYAGARGDIGWYADQQILYEALAAWPAAPERVWTLDDDYCRFRRLDRFEIWAQNGLAPRRRRDLLAMRYSDYNCLVPYAENLEVNDLVLELGLEGARRKRSRRARG